MRGSGAGAERRTEATAAGGGLGGAARTTVRVGASVAARSEAGLGTGGGAASAAGAVTGGVATIAEAPAATGGAPTATSAVAPVVPTPASTDTGPTVVSTDTLGNAGGVRSTAVAVLTYVNDVATTAARAAHLSTADSGYQTMRGPGNRLFE
jgi:hypothetical protein